MFKKLAVICVLGAAIIIAGTGYYIVARNQFSVKHVFIYQVEIYDAGETSKNYSVIIPMPDFYKDESKWTDKIIQDSVKEGIMNISFVNTDNGRGLMINSSNRCELFFNCSVDVPSESLTMYNNISGCAVYAYKDSTDGNYTKLAIYVNLKRYIIEEKESPWPGSMKTWYQLSVYPVAFGWSNYYCHVITND
jgi:hypothetical protein